MSQSTKGNSWTTNFMDRARSNTRTVPTMRGNGRKITKRVMARCIEPLVKRPMRVNTLTILITALEFLRFLHCSILIRGSLRKVSNMAKEARCGTKSVEKLMLEKYMMESLQKIREMVKVLVHI